MLLNINKVNDMSQIEILNLNAADLELLRDYCFNNYDAISSDQISFISETYTNLTFHIDNLNAMTKI